MRKLKAAELGLQYVGGLLLSQHGRELRPSPLGNGYMRVNVKHAGRQHTVLVHRAVAELCIPNPDGLPCVNHKDGDKRNNAPSNLEWVTYSQNAQHAWDTGLVRPYKRTAADRERLAAIARTQPRNAKGHCEKIEGQ